MKHRISANVSANPTADAVIEPEALPPLCHVVSITPFRTAVSHGILSHCAKLYKLQLIRVNNNGLVECNSRCCYWCICNNLHIINRWFIFLDS